MLVGVGLPEIEGDLLGGFPASILIVLRLVSVLILIFSLICLVVAKFNKELNESKKSKLSKVWKVGMCVSIVILILTLCPFFVEYIYSLLK